MLMVEYRDKKRYLWILSVFLPLVPLLWIYIYTLTGYTWLFAVPLFIAYVMIPVFDWWFGEDTDNPPEAIVPQLEDDRYYRYLTWITVPLHLVVLVVMAWFVASYELSTGSVLLLALITGMYSGLGVNTAHELGHKKTVLEKTLAKIALSVPAYGHFCIEHNRGHHMYVAQPMDPASARMGESIYKFAVREIPGTFRGAWSSEKDRLARLSKKTWSPSNGILQSYAISVILQGSLIVAFGWIMVPFLLIHNLWAWFQLTSANYVEHYGLLREKDANGHYQRCLPHHSWNANYIVSNIVLFHLERHSDHHAYPARRYQSLRNFDDIPQLPNGYFGMYLLAYVPWLWFKVMDKRLLTLPHIKGDLSKINIDPSKNALIHARYAAGA